MATIDISRNHKHGTEEAKRRANTLLAKLEKDQGVKGAWAGDTFNITAPAKGTCEVTATIVRIQLDLPFLLRPLKGKIESKINEELERTLA
jgi:putative polyhydroxyalkanoate system protein